ncbi:DUF262 domain-containing protein [Phytoactinopolyspora halotolerans]|uniref:DUF262 domain-containing protein n=1 Tax=Phytoactinopolyspora halotolerans TaxID=1981512 RepID=A0A6L9S9F4_9ACTN|nr:DUF262 domain-containing protein [Phytoactinopolyspora halotolerans]
MSDIHDDEASEALTESAPIPPGERKLITQSYDMSINTLIEQWNDETLVIPEIQREYVWETSKASRLIESLLLNVPIPVLYFAEAPEEKYEVIDGHQRVASIARYIDNQYALTGLKVLNDPEHMRKRFHQLPASEQRRIRTRVIRAIVITDESHPTMKFEVFERLNTGSIALNAQEIRNSTHRGPFMALVKSLVHDETFRKAVGQKSPRKRMADNELIIRYFALRDRLEEYRPPLPRFLNKYCSAANQFGNDKLEVLASDFKLAVRNVYAVFGENSFRLTDSQGNRIDRSLNRALAETQLCTLSDATHEDVAFLREKLTHDLGRIHSQADFLDDIQRATSDRSRTLGRMYRYRDALTAAGLRLR